MRRNDRLRDTAQWALQSARPAPTDRRASSGDDGHETHRRAWQSGSLDPLCRSGRVATVRRPPRRTAPSVMEQRCCPPSNRCSLRTNAAARAPAPMRTARAIPIVRHRRKAHRTARSPRRRSGRRLRVGAEVEAIVRGLTTAGTRNQPRCGASGRLPEHASSSHEAVAAPSLIRQDLASGSWPANATRKLLIAPA
jgi:hypothetical protein